MRRIVTAVFSVGCLASVLGAISQANPTVKGTCFIGIFLSLHFLRTALFVHTQSAGDSET